MADNFVSLARKWRPRRLAELVGQPYVARALQNAAKQNRLHPAFLFTGTRGVGKTTLARIVAMLANCQQGGAEAGEPCLQCESCKAISEGRATDVMEVDAASHTGVDDMRGLLESAAFAPAQAKNRVFIIDEAHMLSKHAFNSMLKTLEEPPPHVKFVLATTELDKVPVTVRSRCLCFALQPLSKDEIAARLKKVLEEEKIAFAAAAVDEIARLANGSLRDGLSLLEQAAAHCEGEIRADDVRRITGEVGWERLQETLAAVLARDAAAIVELTRRNVADNADFDSVLSRIAAALAAAALYAAAPACKPEDEEEAKTAEQLTAALSPEELQTLYEVATRGREQLPLAPSPATGFEMTLLRMMLFAPQAAAGGGGAATPAPAASAPPAAANVANAASAAAATNGAAAGAAAGAANGSANSSANGKANGAPPPISKRGEFTKLLSPLAQSLFDHCAVERADANGAELLVDAQIAPGVVEVALPALQNNLRRLYGGHFNVVLRRGEDNAGERQRQEELLRAAKARPFMRELLAAVPSARIVPGSVRYVQGEANE